jgi:hypothetical protein
MNTNNLLILFCFLSQFLAGQQLNTAYYSFNTPENFIQKSSTRQSTDYSLLGPENHLLVLQTFNQTPAERDATAHDFSKQALQGIYQQGGSPTLVYHFKKSSYQVNVPI